MVFDEYNPRGLTREAPTVVKRDNLWQIVTAPDIAMTDLLGPGFEYMKFPKMGTDLSALAEVIYRRIINTPVLSAVASNPERSFREYWVVAEQMGGIEVNTMLYAIAPNKKYGLDTVDFVYDWDDLFSDKSPEGRARLAQHRKMPGWGLLEKERRIIQDVVESYANDDGRFTDSNKRSILRPIARWRRFEDGKREWNFQYKLGEFYDGIDIRAGIVRGFTAERVGSPKEWVSILGPALIGSLLPELIDSFPENMGYDGNEGEKEMTPTQSLAVSLRFADRFLDPTVLKPVEDRLDRLIVA